MIKRFIEWLKWFWDTLPPYRYHGPPAPGPLTQQRYMAARAKLEAQYAGSMVPLSKEEWGILSKYGTPIIQEPPQKLSMDPGILAQYQNDFENMQKWGALTAAQKQHKIAGEIMAATKRLKQEKKMSRQPKIEYWETELNPIAAIDADTGEAIGTRLVSKWYFHLKASNGAILVTSQGYSSEQACLRGIDAMDHAMYVMWSGQPAHHQMSSDAIKIDR